MVREGLCQVSTHKHFLLDKGNNRINDLDWHLPLLYIRLCRQSGFTPSKISPHCQNEPGFRNTQRTVYYSSCYSYLILLSLLTYHAHNTLDVHYHSYGRPSQLSQTQSNLDRGKRTHSTFFDHRTKTYYSLSM